MGKTKAATDPEVLEFEAAMLRALDQSQRGEGRVTTAAHIVARRAGRPAGSLKAAPKVSTTIRLSPDVVKAFKADGAGWQTRIDAALKDWLSTR
jgi:uncharacterized protein (DUF4415 family)